MNWSKKFKEDLKWGEFGERVMANWLMRYKGFSQPIFNPNKNKDYDFSLVRGGKKILFELKTDRWEHFKNKVTNNLFIETMCSGELSGIHTTKSDIFIYFFPDLEEVYFIKTKDLKELIKTPGLYTTERSGDGGRVRSVLINRNDFRSHFIVEHVTKLPIWNKK